MPFCVYCGKPVKPTEKFCGACGARAPQEILNETPGNYAIDNADIIDVSINDESSETEDGGSIPGYELVITTREKTLKFKTNLDPENIRNKSIYDAYNN